MIASTLHRLSILIRYLCFHYQILWLASIQRQLEVHKTNFAEYSSQVAQSVMMGSAG